jgi:hypothetical protein
MSETSESLTEIENFLANEIGTKLDELKLLVRMFKKININQREVLMERIHQLVSDDSDEETPNIKISTETSDKKESDDKYLTIGNPIVKNPDLEQKRLKEQIQQVKKSDDNYDKYFMPTYGTLLESSDPVLVPQNLLGTHQQIQEQEPLDNQFEKQREYKKRQEEIQEQERQKQLYLLQTQIPRSKIVRQCVDL